MMTAELTDRQKMVLDIIERMLVRGNRPPSIHELMNQTGIASPNGVAKHLNALKAKGYITRDSGARGIKLTDKAAATANSAITIIENRDFEETRRTVYLPLVGNIAAGSPILAQENVEEVLPVPDAITDSNADTFFLRVKGESMIEEGIMPGDLVAIARCESVSNGELAAVMVEDEATVKRFYRRGSMIVLEPANHLYEPIVIDPAQSQVTIIGKVTGLLRSYKGKL